MRKNRISKFVIFFLLFVYHYLVTHPNIFLIETSFQKSECSAYLSTDCQLSKAASGVEAACTPTITSTLHLSAVSALTTENHLQQCRTPQTEADDNSQHN